MITTSITRKSIDPSPVSSKLVLLFSLPMNSFSLKNGLKSKIITSVNILLSTIKLLQDFDLKIPELLWVSHVKISNLTQEVQCPPK